MRTRNCHACGNEATEFAGHVHHGKEVYTAGWCAFCILTEQKTLFAFTACRMFPAGCLGKAMPFHFKIHKPKISHEKNRKANSRPGKENAGGETVLAQLHF